MRKSIIIIVLFVFAGLSSMAETPKWAAKAAKSIFTITTFRADGTILASSNGFFIGENGEALSSYAPFRQAAKAVVIDASGKKYDVISMLGANDVYDVAKFRVNAKKTAPLSIAKQASSIGSQVWLMPYSVKKNGEAIEGKVDKAENFKDNYVYYTFTLSAPENTVSCPFFNTDGQVIGLMQQPATSHDTLSYAICAEYGADLKTTGLSLNDPTLLATSIKTELPDDPEQALVFMYMAASSVDSARFVSITNDYIEKFPDNADGYMYKAQSEANANDFASADKDMEQALKVAKKKDEVHFSYSKLIYQKEVYKSDKSYANWNLDKAASEAMAAYQENPLPIYHSHLADIYFAQKKYQEACDMYLSLTKTNIRSAQQFFAASKCKELLKADSASIYALIDSAVNCFAKPYLKEAAPYIIVRAQYLTDMKKYREAVADYNDYENLMIANVNDNFYYLREQVEIKARLYKQALDDIAKAITMNPTNADYYAEQSSLQLRVNMIDESIKSANEYIRLAPKENEGYLLLGIGLMEKGNKVEGMKNLQKSKEMGNQQAETVIKKYSVK